MAAIRTLLAALIGYFAPVGDVECRHCRDLFARDQKFPGSGSQT